MLAGDNLVSQEGVAVDGGGVLRVVSDRVGLFVGKMLSSSSEADEDDGDDEEGGEDEESALELSRESEPVIIFLHSARLAHSTQCSPASLGRQTMHWLWYSSSHPKQW